MTVNVKDMNKFLLKVNACSGEVYIVHPAGGTENINRNPLRQAELMDEWKENGERLSLLLDIPKLTDAWKLISFSGKKQ